MTPIVFVLLYCCFIGILFFSLLWKKEQNFSENNIYIFIVCFAILITFRPHTYHFSDTSTYAFWFSEEQFNNEILFDLLGKICYKYANLYFFFFLITFFELCFFWFGCKEISKEYAIVLFLGILSSHFFYGITTNTIRQGLALSISFYSISLFFRNRFKSFLLIVVAILVHSSSIVFLVMHLFLIFLKTPLSAFLLWCFSIYLGLFRTFEKKTGYLLFFNERKYDLYITNGDMLYYKAGFRLDFVLYSALPIIIWLYLGNDKRIRGEEKYQYFLRCYLILNAIWLCFIYLPATDRLADLSWSLFSTVSLLPFFCSIEQQDWHKHKEALFLFFCIQIVFSIFMIIKHCLLRPEILI